MDPVISNGGDQLLISIAHDHPIPATVSMLCTRSVFQSCTFCSLTGPTNCPYTEHNEQPTITCRKYGICQPWARDKKLIAIRCTDDMQKNVRILVGMQVCFRHTERDERVRREDHACSIHKQWCTRPLLKVRVENNRKH